MTRTFILPSAALALALLGAGCAPGRPGSGAGGLPSIVVITIDTLRADHVSSYGYFRETTPVIDELAARGVLFRNAVTPMTVTLPVHASLWTSLYPVQTGIITNAVRFHAGSGQRVRFFAEILADLGYQTAAFVSATPVKSQSGINAGFAVFDDPESGMRDGGETTEAVLRWLESEPGRPFFLWVHYFDPHGKHEAPPGYDLYRTDDRLIRYLEAERFPDPEDPEIHELHNQYDGEVRFVDAQIGRIVERLEDRGWLEEAALVVTSDHGEGLGQHDWKRHGKIYNEQIFVPLVMTFPESVGRRGEVRESLVSLIDVVPTLVATLGLPVPEEDRRRFTGLDVLGAEPSREYLLVQRTGKPGLAHWKRRYRFALLSLDWKYFYSPELPPLLYDLRTDRQETRDVAAAYPGVVAEMQEELLALLARLSATGGGLEVMEEISPQVLDHLRALGYLD